MKNIGVIAEYNPFHRGHLFQLEETKIREKADNLVVIMSGNFMQRGEPALFDKWIRAEMAIKGGADLVIELPFVFACNNAEFFAHGAVKILSALNCVSVLSFGSESGSLEALMELASLLSDETEDFKEGLQKFLAEGLSFPRARYETVKELTNPHMAGLLKEPNNILAVEYLKQIIIQASSMTAVTVKRKGPGHFESATSIRKSLTEGKNFEDQLPASTVDIIKNCGQEPVTDSEALFPLIVYKVLTSSEKELSDILSSGEGLEYKLKKALGKSQSFEGLVGALLSKRYTKTRIQRLLIHTLMGLTRDNFFEMLEEKRLYARVLGFSPKGASLLRKIKKDKRSQIPILTNINKELDKDNPLWQLLKYDILASDIYNLTRHACIYSRSDHLMKPYKGESKGRTG